MKKIKVWRCEVDLYRNGTLFRSPKNKLYDRGNTGVWFVAAKSAREAKQLLQKHIRFGSITIPKYQWIPECYRNLTYKEIKKLQPIKETLP